MRWAVANATWHTAHRSAFGAVLADQPLMQNVLADLCVESEAATALAMRLARAYDEEDTGLQAPRHRRRQVLGVQALPDVAFEAMECLGGNGYVEESGMPRLYREAPLNSIWEGSGNVNALDVLRAMAKEPDALEGFFAEVDAAPAPTRAWTPSSPRPGTSSPTSPTSRCGAAHRREARPRAAGLAAGAPRARRGRRRVLRVAAGRRRRPLARHAAGRHGLPRDRRPAHAGPLAAQLPSRRGVGC
jgi:hypothetical protein